MPTRSMSKDYKMGWSDSMKILAFRIEMHMKQTAKEGKPEATAALETILGIVNNDSRPPEYSR